MDRSGERRTGTDRRARAEMYLPWQEADWAPGWDGVERRESERRRDAERRHRIAAGDQVPWYSDDWARARGARDFCDWLDRSALQAPNGLPHNWTPAA